jgi:hypothetical protein
LAEIWDQLGDEQTIAYSLAKDRWLISWDYQQSHWKATGLGQYFLELSPVQAATFLLSIDTMLSSGDNDFRHVSTVVLGSLLQLPARSSGFDFYLKPSHRDALLRLGIVRVEENDGRPQPMVELTAVGKIVISRVLEQDGPLRDAAARLIETEELGGSYRDSKSELHDLLVLVRQTELADDANRQSVIESARLYDDRKYLASLRVLYPSIEAVINSMIARLGEKPDGFRGLVEKARWLEQRGQIPADVSNAVEAFLPGGIEFCMATSPHRRTMYALCVCWRSATCDDSSRSNGRLIRLTVEDRPNKSLHPTGPAFGPCAG